MKHIVEVHIAPDVLSKDYGSEAAALRAVQRLSDAGLIVRYWAGNRRVNLEPRPMKGPVSYRKRIGEDQWQENGT